LGYTCAESVKARLERHKRGNGARILNKCNQLNIEYHIVRTWNSMSIAEAKAFERRLKNLHNAPRLCPECNENYYNFGKYRKEK